MQVRPASGLSFPWEEHIDGGAGYSQGYVFARNLSQCTMTLDCPWSNFVSNQAVREVLGETRFARPGGVALLTRTVPMQHPKFQYLRASKIVGVQGVGPNGKDVEDIAKYDRARLTVQFQQLNYRVVNNQTLANAFGGKEYHRWVTRKVTPVVTFLTQERGSWVWFNGNRPGDPVTFGTPQMVCKNNVELTWLSVPGAGLFGSILSGRAANQENGIGKVNSEVWLGFPKETLLLASISYAESFLFQPAAEIGMNSLGDPSVLYDVTFHMVYFDPPNVVDAAVGRGHNVFPQPNDPSWAVIVTKNGNEKLYPTYNYDTLFVLQ